VGWKGKVQLKFGEDKKVLVAVGRAPLRKGAPLSRRACPFWGERAPVAYLIGRGLNPLQEVWDFLLFFHAAKS
jgi:hypothetical protein